MSPLRILLVEDSPNDAALVLYELRRSGHSAVEHERVQDREAFVAALDVKAWDVIISDWSLPSFSALAALELVKARELDVPFIIVSGSVGEEVAVDAMRAGAHDYILKDRLIKLPTVIERGLREALIRAQNRSLTESTLFLHSVLESSTQYSIVATALDGTILAWNEGARRNYGYSADEVIGRRTLRFLHIPEDLASGRIDAFLDTARETGKAEAVFERIRKDGTHFTALLAITVRRDALGQPAGYVKIEKDITQELQLEKQVRRNEELEALNARVQEATRQKSEFLANMSHELRTPLNGIIGLAQLMHDQKVGPVAANHCEYLGDILTSANHLLQLINDVLDLAKVESGTLVFRPEAIILRRLLVEVCDILRALSDAKRIRVISDVDPSVDNMVADPAKLKQVLYNYLSNALKFTPDGGRIAVRAVPEAGDNVRIEVTDTGIGIGADQFDQLFVEFRQLDSGPKKRYGGTGLGLALTRRIVEAQGGRVGVTSTLGEGSTFFAVLPRISEPTVAVLDTDSRPTRPLPRVIT